MSRRLIASCLAALAALMAPGAFTHAAEVKVAARVADPDQPITATDARVGGDETRTRFIVDLNRTTDLSAFTLAEPYRVVIDLPQVAFQLPAKAGEAGRGLIKAFRFGLVMQGGSRIVLDLTGPVRIDKAFVLDPIESQPARLVVDLVAVDRETFMRAQALDKAPRRVFGMASRPAPEKEPPAKSDDPRPLIMLDPGHGGLDGGTSAATGELEKVVVFEFATKLREKLEKAGKYRVMMTRNDDTFVPLGERVRLARAHKASLLISIHADALANRDPDTRGATIYTLSEHASDAEAARLAESENKADVIAGVDLSAEPDEVADILIELARRETKTFSTQFARTLVGEFRNAARLHKNPIRSAGFLVLKAPDVPSVLLELGYMSNKQDMKLLTSDEWRSRAADAVVHSIDTFFTTRIAGGAATAGSN